MLPNTYCSRHYHQERANLFYVRHGRVRIESWGSSEVVAEPIGEPDFWVLSEGDTITIPSRIWHRFVVLRDHSEMVEVYWPDRGSIVRMDDIYRYDVGGDNEA
jgi:quercetin dioxygenase-like cupin family protein